MTKAELIGFAAFKGYWAILGDEGASFLAWEQLPPLERRAWIGAGMAATTPLRDPLAGEHAHLTDGPPGPPAGPP